MPCHPPPKEQQRMGGLSVEMNCEWLQQKISLGRSSTKKELVGTLSFLGQGSSSASSHYQLPISNSRRVKSAPRSRTIHSGRAALTATHLHSHPAYSPRSPSRLSVSDPQILHGVRCQQGGPKPIRSAGRPPLSGLWLLTTFHALVRLTLDLGS